MSKGIQPALLLKQVENTASWIFNLESSPRLDFIEILRSVQRSPVHADALTELSRANYFELCIAAHFATVASLVPTDLDQTIRLKIWHNASPDDIREMTKAVFKFLDWNECLISKRWLRSPHQEIHLSGHLGEWFSIAIPAWNACRINHLHTEAGLLENAVLEKIESQEEAFSEFLESKMAIDSLKACTLIAHNLGDLDRVIDLWALSKENSFIHEIYGLGHLAKPSRDLLLLAGDLNKSAMASENHRHYALREARALRQSSDFLIGIGPFFDDWGRTLVRHPFISSNDLGEIATILTDAWGKLNQKDEVFGYARALAGMISNVRGGLDTILREMPASRRKLMSSGPLKQMIEKSSDEFTHLYECKLRKFIEKNRR